MKYAYILILLALLGCDSKVVSQCKQECDEAGKSMQASPKDIAECRVLCRENKGDCPLRGDSEGLNSGEKCLSMIWSAGHYVK